jgi:hypothetical protein
MLSIVGLVVVMGAVFGVFVLHGGDLTPVIAAAPTEFASIFGAALGAMLVANGMDTVKGVAGGFGKVFTAFISFACCLRNCLHEAIWLQPGRFNLFGGPDWQDVRVPKFRFLPTRTATPSRFACQSAPGSSKTNRPTWLTFANAKPDRQGLDK